MDDLPAVVLACLGVDVDIELVVDGLVELLEVGPELGDELGLGIGGPVEERLLDVVLVVVAVVDMLVEVVYGEGELLLDELLQGLVVGVGVLGDVDGPVGLDGVEDGLVEVEDQDEFLVRDEFPRG